MTEKEFKENGTDTRKELRPGRVLMTLGLILVLGAGGITAYNLWDESRAETASEEVLAELLPEIPVKNEETPAADGRPAAEQPKPVPMWVLNPDLQMPEVMVNGDAYIGTVEIPSLSLTLPVMSDWDYTKLKTAPCRYAGSAYHDDLVICAHNYRKHFSRIKWMNSGDAVNFTDTDGNVFRYTVADVEVLNPTATEAMTSGDWDLTLFTCTTGGQTRFALRCDRLEQ